MEDVEAMSAPGPLTVKQVKRFWARVTVGAPDECWPWLGSSSRTKGRYGSLGFDGKIRQAHHVAFRLVHGYYPPYLRHSCDFGLCCNDAHLLEGTHTDNMRDKMERGRHVYAQAKLTEEQVIAIRADPRGCRKLAKAFGIDRSQIARIRSHKTWRHVP